MNSSTLIISPSGNFYGSEQVLFDFLSATKNRYIVFVPRYSLLYEKLVEFSLHRRHQLKTFKTSSLYALYFRIALHILWARNRHVYINEGGHIKWAKLIARIFPKRKVLVHLRMIYDTDSSRVGSITNNIHLIAISEYVLQALGKRKSHLIYDAYRFKAVPSVENSPISSLKIGIIGRVTITKGLNKFLDFINYIEQYDLNQRPFEFHFFGGITLKKETIEVVDKINSLDSVVTVFHGFTDKEKIFDSIDVVLHLNPDEALGRVFFEALDYLKPFVGCKQGGIGELAKSVGLDSVLFSYENEYWCEELKDVLLDISRNYPARLKQASIAREQAASIYNINSYIKNIEKILA